MAVAPVMRHGDPLMGTAVGGRNREYRAQAQDTDNGKEKSHGSPNGRDQYKPPYLDVRYVIIAAVMRMTITIYTIDDI